MLPHDAVMEKPVFEDSINGKSTGFRDGEVYHYVKTLFAPEEYKSKTVTLHFEGIYMNAMVYVNGELAGKCPYGYSGIYVNIDEYLKYGAENEIHVIVKNQNMPNSRWYSGGGIYRDAYLMTEDTVYIEPDSVEVITKTLQNGYANLEIRTSILNQRYHTVKLKLTTEVKDECNTTASKEVTPVILFTGEKRIITQHIIVEEPKTWSPDSPAIYTFNSVLDEENNRLDENYTTFGIRILSVDEKIGLLVNGCSEKLRGACIHHDNGLLGAATYYEADGIMYPNRLIVGSETFSPEIARNWERVQRLNHVIGDFTWTGWDYIGEAGVGIQKFQSDNTEDKTCCQLAYCGDFDITGFRRPFSTIVKLSLDYGKTHILLYSIQSILKRKTKKSLGIN